MFALNDLQKGFIRGLTGKQLEIAFRLAAEEITFTRNVTLFSRISVPLEEITDANIHSVLFRLLKFADGSDNRDGYKIRVLKRIFGLSFDENIVSSDWVTATCTSLLELLEPTAELRYLLSLLTQKRDCTEKDAADAMLLVRSKADPNICDHSFIPLLHHLVRALNTSNGEFITELVNKWKANIDIKWNNNTPLEYMLDRKYTFEEIKLLLTLKANPNSCNSKGMPLLHWLTVGDVEGGLRDYLISIKLDENFFSTVFKPDMNIKWKGETVLQRLLVEKSFNPENIKMLSNLGAQLTQKEFDDIYTKVSDKSHKEKLKHVSKELKLKRLESNGQGLFLYHETHSVRVPIEPVEPAVNYTDESIYIKRP